MILGSISISVLPKITDMPQVVISNSNLYLYLAPLCAQ